MIQRLPLFFVMICHVWKQLNVTAVTISGIVGTIEGIIGENYEDASGNQYLPMVAQPIMIFSANAEQIK